MAPKIISMDIFVMSVIYGEKFISKLYFFYKKIYYFHSSAGTHSSCGIFTFSNSNFTF